MSCFHIFHHTRSTRTIARCMHLATFMLVVLISVLALAPQFGHTSSVAAATLKSYTFTVNTTSDTHDAQLGDGVCADSIGQCSLRASTEEADALPAGSSITITVPTGTYALTLGTLYLKGQRTISIHGAGSTTTIIKGNHTFTILLISPKMSAHLSQLTIEGGSAPNYGSGGGINNSGTLTVSTSTFSSNSAGGVNGGGGGICNSGMASVSSSTFSGNSAPTGGGGGIDNGGSSSTVTLTGTIVANSPTGSNCSGTITEGAGYNLDSGTSCGFTLSSDLTNTDPLLGPLGDNGGPTQTMALLQGSKAIDWVAATSCPATDQRGYMRPDNSESTCDIGAYESSY